MSQKTQSETLTVKDLMERYNVVRKTVIRWIEAGEFPNAYRVSPLPGSPYRIPDEDVKAFESRRKLLVN